MANIDWDAASALIDAYTPQELYTAWSKRKENPKFLSGMLINRDTKTHRSKEFSFDIKSEGATIPTYCTPKSQTSLVQFGGFETVKSTTPYINEGFEITVDDFETRVFGIDAATWGKMTMAQRAAMIVADKDRQMKARLDSTDEVQLAQQIQTGVIDVSGKDVDLEISIRMAADHKVTLTADARWNQAASEGTRIAGIKTQLDKMRDDRGGLGSDIIMGASAFANLQSDPQYFERLNMRNTADKMGSYDPRFIDAGEGYIQYVGTLQIDSYVVNLYVNADTYTDNDGNAAYYIEQDSYVLVNRRMPTRKHYGRIENMAAWNAGLETAELYTYIDTDKNGKWMRKVYESAPVVACEDASSIVYVKTV